MDLSAEDREKLRLIDIEILASWVSVAASLILIDSGHRARRLIIQGRDDDDEGGFLGSVTEEAFDATLLAFISTALFTGVAFYRLEQVSRDIAAGTSDQALWPNVAITLGFVYALIGNLLRYDGVLGRAEEKQPITIL